MTSTCRRASARHRWPGRSSKGSRSSPRASPASGTPSCAPRPRTLSGSRKRSPRPRRQRAPRAAARRRSTPSGGTRTPGTRRSTSRTRKLWKPLLPPATPTRRRRRATTPRRFTSAENSFQACLLNDQRKTLKRQHQLVRDSRQRNTKAPKLIEHQRLKHTKAGNASKLIYYKSSKGYNTYTKVVPNTLI